MQILILLVLTFTFAQATFGMGNPSSAFCVQLGGEEKMLSDSQENAGTGMASIESCLFGRGEIEAWTLFRELNGGAKQAAIVTFFKHPEKSTEAPTENSVRLANPASVYCGRVGGDLKMYFTKDGQQGLCAFPDGSAIEEWTLFRGPSDPTNAKLVAALKSGRRNPAHSKK